jgi:3D (Asp-Asp-Asp) domain-containing protein
VLFLVAGCGGDEGGAAPNSDGGASGRDAGSLQGSGGLASSDGGSSGGFVGRGGARPSSGGSGTGGTTASGGSATGGIASNGGSGTGGTAAGGGSGLDSGSPTDSGSGGSNGSPGASLGSFVLTYYWVTAEDDFPGTKDTTLYDDSCGVIAVVTSGFADSLSVEGTGRLSDGRVVNVSGSCSCATSPCYGVVDAQHPWGYGAQNNALVPFRSIAVDRTVIALGTHLYIQEFDGVTMPGDPSYGGFVHDGCVSADDVGGGIVGKHVDFFAALEANYRTLDGELGLNSVTVYAGGTRCP